MPAKAIIMQVLSPILRFIPHSAFYSHSAFYPPIPRFIPLFRRLSLIPRFIPDSVPPFRIRHSVISDPRFTLTRQTAVT